MLLFECHLWNELMGGDALGRQQYYEWFTRFKSDRRNMILDQEYPRTQLMTLTFKQSSIWCLQTVSDCHRTWRRGWHLKRAVSWYFTPKTEYTSSFSFNYQQKEIEWTITCNSLGKPTMTKYSCKRIADCNNRHEHWDTLHKTNNSTKVSAY